jgi:hypothetical protein
MITMGAALGTMKVSKNIECGSTLHTASLDAINQGL